MFLKIPLISFLVYRLWWTTVPLNLSLVYTYTLWMFGLFHTLSEIMIASCTGRMVHCAIHDHCYLITNNLFVVMSLLTHHADGCGNGDKCNGRYITYTCTHQVTEAICLYSEGTGGHFFHVDLQQCCIALQIKVLQPIKRLS